MPHSANYPSALGKFILPAAVMILWMTGISPALCQKTRVVIVFDNSGSMAGTQCDYANYSLKLMAALLDNKDFSLKVVDQNTRKKAKSIDLSDGSRQGYLDRLGWVCSNGGIYAETVETAVRAFPEAEETENWMIILSDGEADQSELTGNLIDFAKRGGHIMYINTDIIHNQNNLVIDFLQRSIPASQLEILETNSNPQEILKTMDYIARMLEAADVAPLKYSVTGTTLSLTSILPLKSLTILEQNQSKSIASILSATQNGQSLQIVNSLTVTQNNLTGGVHRIRGAAGRQVIPSGNINVSFSKPMTSGNVTIIAQPMADVLVRVEGDILSSKDKLYKVCSDDVRLIVSVVTSDDGISWHTVGKDVLSNTNVKIEFLNRKIELQLKDSVFVANIKMGAPYFPVSLTARYEGYFNIKRNAVILDRDTCSVGNVVIPAQPRFSIDQLTDHDFKGFQYLPRIIVNGVEREVTSDEFRNLELLAIAKDGLNLEITKSKKDTSWFVKPSSDAMCLCFLRPGKRIIELEMTSSDGKILPVKKDLEIEITLEGTTFWERCGKLILGLFSFLVLLWYVYGIITKRRFDSGAMIEYHRETDIVTKSYPTPLKTHFFNRYTIPYLTEMNTIEGITFLASRRSSYIEIPKDDITDKMSVGGLPLETGLNYNSKLSDGESLAVSSGNKTEYYQYNSYSS